jgi:hypothetical protein
MSATQSGKRNGRHIAFVLLLMVFTAASLCGCSDRKAKFAGVWKSNCKDYWGVQIIPLQDSLYSVTFCGLSGCLLAGEWMPNTRIEGDPMYQVASSTKIRIKSNDRGYFTYTRCSADPSWQARPGNY